MTTKQTPNGPIHFGGRCKDDYDNIGTAQIQGVSVTLQHPAIRAYREATERYGHPISNTGTHRSCAEQARLYRSDPSRFAPPDVTLHTRGLAVDVIVPIDRSRRDALHRAMTHAGWLQARPDDEPWHWSYGVKA